MVTVLVLNASAILAGDLTSVFVLLFSLVFGLIGMVDDYAKIKKKENTGLTASQKFLLQLAAAVLFTVLLRNFGILSPNLYIPFLGIEWKLPWVVYMIFAAFVITGCVNYVNITDGVDGLASSVTLVVSVFFTACFTYAHLMWNTTGSAGMAVFAAALAGGLVGFLVYNFHPAKVFMGDTGSLFLGGAVCGMAFALDMPLILILVGIIYIAETMSDIIQVGYFKLTHGKRIFRMAPLHHHLEMGGWSEKKLCYVFAGITLVCCILAFIGVMGRFPAL
jgi:phospho-N-acetylmuramoyl-pentapeptide-transferase